MNSEDGRGQDRKDRKPYGKGPRKRNYDPMKRDANKLWPLNSRKRKERELRSNRENGGRPRNYDRTPRSERPPRPEKPRLPTDPQKLLFKGVDLQAKGNDEKALVYFLHGSVLMSKGCENNASKIIDSKKDDLPGLRSRIAEECSEDALVEFDYLCIKADDSYDRTSFDNEFSKNNIWAIYRSICMDEVGPEDDVIDVFASGTDEKMVMDGLKTLVKRKESKKAGECIERIEERKKRKQYVHVAFSRAMKGDQDSRRDLKRLSSEFPEAAFFLGYVEARDKGVHIEWLKEKFPQFSDLIISEEFNLRIGDDPYGMYLRAMKIKSKKEDWVPSMIKAAKNGSEEAMEELRPLMYKTAIKKAVANIHLTENDFQGLIEDYVNGLDETYYLDKYCENVPDRIVEAGRRIGEISPEREIDWLRAHAFMVECRDALSARAEDEKYHCRKMIYALHDVGRDIEAADLYFAMEGDPDLPVVKWLAKVCRNEDAKEYVRAHFEEKGELDVFESIFVDDGYRKRGKGRR